MHSILKAADHKTWILERFLRAGIIGKIEKKRCCVRVARDDE